MPQRLKEDVQQSIVRGAIRVFAQEGFRGATMAEIARASGVSAGNIYHYYHDKDDLFDAVLSDDFVHDFTRLLHRRIDALDGVADLRTLEPGAPYAAASEALMAFSIRDRLRLVVLLDRAEGTRHAAFAGRLVRDLQRRALAYARTVRPAFRVTAALRFVLEQIYRNWLRTLVTILERFETESEIGEVVASFSSYHLAGLKVLLQKGESS